MIHTRVMGETENVGIEAGVRGSAGGIFGSSLLIVTTFNEIYGIRKEIS